jgi:hypothetical protein
MADNSIQMPENDHFRLIAMFSLLERRAFFSAFAFGTRLPGVFS